MIKKQKTVLLIQHASAFGGSAMSLIYTLRAIKKNTMVMSTNY